MNGMQSALNNIGIRFAEARELVRCWSGLRIKRMDRF